MSRIIDELWGGGSRTARIAGFALLALLALLVRGAALRYAYPAPGDVVHFVQHGVEQANGGAAAWSAALSPGPQWLSGVSARAGLSPARSLQMLAVVSGVLCTVLSMGMAWRLFGRWPVALLAGLLIACNPCLVYYSVGGWSEMPYIALLAAAALLVARDVTRGAPGGSWIAAMAVLGVGACFRTLEAHAMAAACTALGVLAALAGRRWRSLLPLFAGALVFAAAVFPVYWITYRATGRFAPGTKDVNLVMGEHNYDSKAMHAIREPWADEYAVLQREGTARYVWEHRSQFVARWTQNLLRALRYMNEDLFVGPFRMGTAWFLLLFLYGSLAAVRGGRARPWIVCLVFAAVPIAGIALANVQPRYLAQSLPFVLLLFSDLVLTVMAVSSRLVVRGLLAACVLAFAAGNASLAVRQVVETDWYYWNGAAAGKALQKFGSDEETLMTQQYCVALHFHERHPGRLVGLPYASIEETADYARQRNVSLIAVSDRVFPHWPVNALFHGAKPPADWTLLTELTFSRESRFGDDVENYLLFRRTPTPSGGDTAAGDNGP